MFESLETRRMLSAGYSVSGSRLTITGSTDADVITVEQTGPKSFEVFNNGTTDSISSNRVIKQIVVYGDADDDCIVIFPSVTVATTLYGEAGDDTLVGGSAGDKFSGGDGIDTADYSNRQENLRLSIQNVADDGKFGEGDNICTDVENVLGGSGNDVIVGTSDANFIDGGAGDDDIFALGGNDLIFGGEGDDSLDGGTGMDSIAGNYGSDYMLGGDDDDLFEANDGEVDTIIGGGGFDTAWADSSIVVDNVNAEDVFLI